MKTIILLIILIFACSIISEADLPQKLPKINFSNYSILEIRDNCNLNVHNKFGPNTSEFLQNIFNDVINNAPAPKPDDLLNIVKYSELVKRNHEYKWLYILAKDFIHDNIKSYSRYFIVFNDSIGNIDYVSSKDSYKSDTIGHAFNNTLATFTEVFKDKYVNFNEDFATSIIVYYGNSQDTIVRTFMIDNFFPGINTCPQNDLKYVNLIYRFLQRKTDDMRCKNCK